MSTRILVRHTWAPIWINARDSIVWLPLRPITALVTRGEINLHGERTIYKRFQRSSIPYDSHVLMLCICYCNKCICIACDRSSERHFFCGGSNCELSVINYERSARAQNARHLVQLDTLGVFFDGIVCFSNRRAFVGLRVQSGVFE